VATALGTTVVASPIPTAAVIAPAEVGNNVSDVLGSRVTAAAAGLPQFGQNPAPCGTLLPHLVHQEGGASIK
jgi:hypothetical protein